MIQRLFTYDPPGSLNNPSGNAYQYNTGRYDDSAPQGQGCSNPDPQGFNDYNTMVAYAVAHSEDVHGPVTREQLTFLCSNTGRTYQGGTQTVSIDPIVRSNVAAAIAPSLTPGSYGSVPGSSGSVGQVPTRLNGLYRFILVDPNNPAGAYSTGSNYPGCSQTNAANCDPQAFMSLGDAIAYATERGEIPYQVQSADEAWGLIGGTIPIDRSRVLSGSSKLPLLILAGLAAFVLFRK